MNKKNGFVCKPDGNISSSGFFIFDGFKFYNQLFLAANSSIYICNKSINNYLHYQNAFQAALLSMDSCRFHK